MKITVNKNANAVSFVIFAVLAVAAYLRLPDITRGKSSVIAWGAALLGSLLILFPHELLHAVCFKNDVYLYTNFKQGMLFVVGTESTISTVVDAQITNV